MEALAVGQYVRCPADWESKANPRIFVCGKVTGIDEIKATATVTIYDPFDTSGFFEYLKMGNQEFQISRLNRCTAFKNSLVSYRGHVCTVLCSKKDKATDFQYYYVQEQSTKKIGYICEKNLEIPYHNGRIDPTKQLMNYEFQQPCWYYGRAVVSRNMRILENSLYGFKELAGAKIYLLPHQVNTIMRCLQENPCRFMLADEVGMGKTIEAISVCMIYMLSHSNKKILIMVPQTLKEQWITELFFKFDIADGKNCNNNTVFIYSAEEFDDAKAENHYDFTVIDEVHRYLSQPAIYRRIHRTSFNSDNILLLSATPVQQRRDEYLSLLRLLQPQIYDSFTETKFDELIQKQTTVVEQTYLLLSDLSDYEEEVQNCLADEQKPAESEDCEELFEEISERLENILKLLPDQALQNLYNQVSLDAEDGGVYAIKVIAAYICANYQIASNIIRNRRKMLESHDEEHQVAKRALVELPYELNEEHNLYEKLTYEALTDWILNATKNDSHAAETFVEKLTGAFFSSPWAFKQVVLEPKDDDDLWQNLQYNADKWLNFENLILDSPRNILNNPDEYEDLYCTRIITVLNYLSEEVYDQKVVLFTNYSATFSAYRIALEKIIEKGHVSFFCAGMDSDDLELNVYRFQNDSECHIMLCDQTGGEGRNFQCADYVIHIDLPWDANAIEQRIGRLDRLGRSPERDTVTSVVVYAENTFESSLFRFWNEGLNIFQYSLSGMEIIMGDINRLIFKAVQEDFRYGLEEAIPQIIQSADQMRQTVKKEQHYDAAAMIYHPMYNELSKLIDYYRKNENVLFAESMTQWSALAGFNGRSSGEDVIAYSDASFSPGSAIKAMFIPPVWDTYMNDKQNALLSRVQQEYASGKRSYKPQREIKGTFIRKAAIENDYLHFFSPGDQVFDSIVDNALNSCKGQASAFTYNAQHEWKGFFFTWSLMPYEADLYRNGVDPIMLSEYRNFITTKQVIVPVSIENPDGLSDEELIKIYNEMIGSGFKKSKAVHLGSREKMPAFLKSVSDMEYKSAIDWFRKNHTEELWVTQIENARNESKTKALNLFMQHSNLNGAKEEMDRVLSAREANAAYYGMTDSSIENLRQQQQLILNALRHAQTYLDSAAYIWMVKQENEPEL